MASLGSQTSGCIVCAQLGCRAGRVSWELPLDSEEGREIWPRWPPPAPLFFADRFWATSLSSSLAVSSSFQGKQNPESELTMQGTGRGSEKC